MKIVYYLSFSASQSQSPFLGFRPWSVTSRSPILRWVLPLVPSFWVYAFLCLLLLYFKNVKMRLHATWWHSTIVPFQAPYLTIDAKCLYNASKHAHESKNQHLGIFKQLSFCPLGTSTQFNVLDLNQKYSFKYQTFLIPCYFCSWFHFFYSL